jgi:hypothetical protein
MKGRREYNLILSFVSVLQDQGVFLAIVELCKYLINLAAFLHGRPDAKHIL